MLQEREGRDSHQKERFDRGSKECKDIKEMIAANEKASQDRHDMIVRHTCWANGHRRGRAARNGTKRALWSRVPFFCVSL